MIRQVTFDQRLNVLAQPDADQNTIIMHYDPSANGSTVASVEIKEVAVHFNHR